MKNIFQKVLYKLLTFFHKGCIIKINEKGGRAMTIIEREIERREKLIEGNADKVKEIEELTAKIERLKRERDEFDEVAIRAEIAELETYLPKPEPIPKVVTEETPQEILAETPTPDETY